VLLCLLLQLPAIYLPFLIAFLPRADAPGTGWVFAQAPQLSRELVQDATWRALVTHVLLPVHGLALVLLWCLSPEPLAVTAAALFAFGTAVLAGRMFVRTLEHVPFTQSGEADAGTDLGAAFGGALGLGGLGTAFGLALPPGLRWVAAGLAIALAVLALQRHATIRDAALATATPEASERAEPEPGSADGTAEPEAPTTSLGRELRAIAVLYAAVSVLPMLVGTMFAS
jgi:hypothetical protein